MLEFQEHSAFAVDLGESMGFVIRKNENDWITLIVRHSGQEAVLADRHSSRQDAIDSIVEYSIYDLVEYTMELAGTDEIHVCGDCQKGM
jgi:hypothetical protein